MPIVHKQKAFQYFKEHFVLGRPSPKKWYPMDCPFCGKTMKMAVQFHQNTVKCWVCGVNGTILDFVQEVEKVTLKEAEKIILNIRPSAISLDLLQDEEEREQKVASVGKLPYGYRSLLEGEGMIGTRVRNYLTGRGFDVEKMDSEGFGYCAKHDKENPLMDFYGYLIIPYKRNGRLNYFIGRDFMDQYLRYKNPPTDLFGVGKSDIIYNEDALKTHKTALVFEGALDAYTMGKSATATSGWALSPRQMGIYMGSKVKNLIFVPDAGSDGEDGAGELFYNKAVTLAMSFLDTHITPRVVNLNTPEIMRYGKDANEIGRKIMQDVIKSTPALTWTDAIEILNSND